ncbi:hypothetical protein SDC9_103838 [bioreactor metagenome]|uniref:Uncharacterized protein n=1 Tax=bioreactor metagenome TaxID=1076179 RepID=A0A645AXJ6_9ZZZZ
MEPVGDVSHQAQNRVCAEKALRQRQSPVSGVIQRPLQPLGACGHGGVHSVGHQIAGKGTDALRAHGIAFVGHGGGADLVFLKGFLQLPVVLQKAQVARKAIAALGNGGQNVQHPAVKLSGIGLAAHGKAPVESKRGGEHPVHLVNLPAVALEKVHEAGLGAGGAPTA